MADTIQKINPRTGMFDMMVDPASILIPDGIPAPRDASSGDFPAATAGVADRWIIQVAGTLPAPIGDVEVWDAIIRDGTTRHKIDGPIPVTVTKSNEILINTTDPEVAGKQYQSVANANTYLESIPATTPRAIGLAGVYAPDIEAIDYGDIFGDGAGNTILGNVSLKTATAVQNNFYDCTIGKLIMKDICGSATPVVASVARTVDYIPHHTTISTGGATPTSGTYSITVDSNVLVFQYNATALDIQNAIRALGGGTKYALVTVTGDITNGFTITEDGRDANLGIGLITVADIDLNPSVSFTVKPFGGSQEQQTISFDSVPTTGQWMISYLYDAITYYSPVLDYNSDATAVQTAIRDIFAQINVAGPNLGETALTVSGDYTTGFIATLLTYPGASEELFGIYAGPVSASYATYAGTLAGTATAILVTADVIGAGGNNEVYTFDGIGTIQVGIDGRNAANPGNTISLTSGDGTQVPNNKTKLILSGGADEYIYNLEWVGSVLGQNCKLESIDLVDFEVTGTNSTLITNGGSIEGGDFSGVKTFYTNDTDIIGGTFGNKGNIWGGSVNLTGTTIASGGLTINGSTLYGINVLTETLTIKGTIGGVITIEAGATLNTHECINLTVNNNGGTWNDYSKIISGIGSPIDNNITPLALACGVPQTYFDTVTRNRYTATGLTAGAWILS